MVEKPKRKFASASEGGYHQALREDDAEGLKQCETLPALETDSKKRGFVWGMAKVAVLRSRISVPLQRTALQGGSSKGVEKSGLGVSAADLPTRSTGFPGGRIPATHGTSMQETDGGRRRTSRNGQKQLKE